MRRLGLILSLLAALGLGPWAWIPGHAQVGPPNTIQCNHLSTTQPSGTGLTTIIPAVAGQIIVICGWHVTNNASTTATFQISYGTGTNCVTTNVNLTPALNVLNSAPSQDHVDFASLSTPVGAQVCAIVSVATLQVAVWYAQF